jgi:hypothetical protein
MQDALQRRLLALALIVGVVVIAVANALHPDNPQPADSLQWIPVIGKTPGWSLIHWGLGLGAIFLNAAIAIVAHALAVERGAGATAAARATIYLVLVSLAVFLVLIGVEVAVRDSLRRAPADPGMMVATRALVLLGDAMITAWLVVFWASLGLFGLALAGSAQFPKWLGWVGAAIGAWVVLGVGVPRALAGASPWTEGPAFELAAILTLLWLAAVAVFEWRNAKA